jgi:hypothetical protein
MIHQPSGGAKGQATDIKIVADHILRTKAKLNKILAENTGKDIEVIAQDTERDNFMSAEEADRLGKCLFKPNGGLSPDVVGKSAGHLAQLAGFTVPNGTKILVARADKVGPQHPYSMEKLCPVLALFVEPDEDAVMAKALEILHLEGSDHTFAIHAEDTDTIRRFALEMPVSRFLVNTPAALGGIGHSTGLFPALTLGCGAVGGSSSSNNISPMDLINVRRVAWDLDRQPESGPVVDGDLVELLTAKILERLR